MAYAKTPGGGGRPLTPQELAIALWIDNPKNNSPRAQYDLTPDNNTGPAGGVNEDLLGLLTGNSPTSGGNEPSGSNQGVSFLFDDLGKNQPQNPFQPPSQPSNRNAPSALDQQVAALMEVIQGNDTTFDYESALRESEAAIREAYAGDIGAIRTNNKQARAQTGRDRAEMEDMYNALSRSYRRQGDRQMQQGDRLADNMASMSERGADEVEDRSDRYSHQSNKLAKMLGIEGVTHQNNRRQHEKMEHVTGQINREGTDDARTQLGYAGANQRFMNRGGMGAQLEGVNRSGDLLADLQDYTQGNRDLITNLQGQRTKEIASNEQGVMAAQAEMEQTAQAEQWDQLMELTNFQQGVEQANIDNRFTRQGLNLQRAGLTASTAEAEAAESPVPDFMQQYTDILGQSRAQGGMGGRALAALLDPIMASEEFRDQRYDSGGETVKMNPQKAQNAAIYYAKKENPNISDSDLQLIGLAAMVRQMGIGG